MTVSVSQLVEPKIVNFVPSGNRVFQSTQLKAVIKEQNEARFESIKDVELREFAKNYTNLYGNEAADFSIDGLESDTVSSIEQFRLVAFKVFNQVDVPATSTLITTDKKITASELSQFIFKADFLLNKVVNLLDPDETNITFNQIAYFNSKLNDIFEEVEKLNKPVTLIEFITIFQKHVDSKKIEDFDDVLFEVIAILDNIVDEKPVVFNAFF